MATEFIFKNNVLEIVQPYEALLLDIWGVIHDGQNTYPGVVENLQKLRAMGKKIYFLSNAPRRSNRVATVLAGFGIHKELYDFIMTSGEATYIFLEENQNSNFSKFGRNYYYIGPDKDLDLLKGLDYQKTDDANKADFVINTGFDHDFSKLEEKMPQLQKAIAHKLPMICVNPDLIVVKQNGHEMLCAGILATEYKKMGGEVTYIGKPYNLVYNMIFQLFSIKEKNKILAVGDGIETDILGANNSDIDSALIPGGILSNRLKIKHGQLPSREDMESVCRYYQTYPQFIISNL